MFKLLSPDIISLTSEYVRKMDVAPSTISNLVPSNINSRKYHKGSLSTHVGDHLPQHQMTLGHVQLFCLE